MTATYRQITFEDFEGLMEPRVGRWEPVKGESGYIDFRCSVCRRFRFHNGEMRKKYKYCPNCGSKMEVK